MYICMYVCMYVCMRIYVYVCMCASLYVCVCLCVQQLLLWIHYVPGINLGTTRGMRQKCGPWHCGWLCHPWNEWLGTLCGWKKNFVLVETTVVLGFSITHGYTSSYLYRRQVSFHQLVSDFLMEQKAKIIKTEKEWGSEVEVWVEWKKKNNKQTKEKIKGTGEDMRKQEPSALLVRR